MVTCGNEGNKNYSLVTSKTVKDAVIKTSTSKNFNKDTGRKQREVFTYTDAMKVNEEKNEEKVSANNSKTASDYLGGRQFTCDRGVQSIKQTWL